MTRRVDGAELSLPARPPLAAGRLGLRTPAGGTARDRLERRHHPRLPSRRRPGHDRLEALGAAVVDPRRRRVHRPRGLRRRGAARGRSSPTARPRCRSTPTTCPGSRSRRRCGSSGGGRRRLGAGARPRRLPRHAPGEALVRRRAARRGFDEIDGARQDAAAFDGAGRPGSRRRSSISSCSRRSLPAGHLRLRLLRLPRAAAPARPGCARSATAGTSSPSSSRTRSGSRASRSSTGSSFPFADPVDRPAPPRPDLGQRGAAAARGARGAARRRSSPSSAASASTTSSSATPTPRSSRRVHRLGRGAHRVPAG